MHAEDNQINSKEEKHDTLSNQESEVEDFSTTDLNCRFYRNEWPEKDDLVMVSTSI
jgi:hypothetical protein